MAINKVIYGSNTLIDISDTTAQAADVENGKDFYLNDGTKATGSYIYDWKGYKPELVERVFEQEYALEDTLFNGWTPSTTGLAIVATSNVKTFAADLAHYEYLLVWKIKAIPVYADGTVLKAAPIKEVTVINQAIFKRPNSVTNIEADNFAGNACVTLYTTPLNMYYTTAGKLSYTYSVSYGLYGSGTAATFSNSSSNTPNITIKTPALYARCSSTYFSTAMANAIDQENSKMYVVGELYRFPVGSTMRGLYNDMIDYFNEEIPQETRGLNMTRGNIEERNLNIEEPQEELNDFSDEEER